MSTGTIFPGNQTILITEIDPTISKQLQTFLDQTIKVSHYCRQVSGVIYINFHSPKDALNTCEQIRVDIQDRYPNRPPVVKLKKEYSYGYFPVLIQHLPDMVDHDDLKSVFSAIAELQERKPIWIDPSNTHAYANFKTYAGAQKCIEMSKDPCHRDLFMIKNVILQVCPAAKTLFVSKLKEICGERGGTFDIDDARRLWQHGQSPVHEVRKILNTIPDLIEIDAGDVYVFAPEHDRFLESFSGSSQEEDDFPDTVNNGSFSMTQKEIKVYEPSFCSKLKSTTGGMDAVENLVPERSPVQAFQQFNVDKMEYVSQLFRQLWESAYGGPWIDQHITSSTVLKLLDEFKPSEFEDGFTRHLLAVHHSIQTWSLETFEFFLNDVDTTFSKAAIMVKKDDFDVDFDHGKLLSSYDKLATYSNLDSFYHNLVTEIQNSNEDIIRQSIHHLCVIGDLSLSDVDESSDFDKMEFLFEATVASLCCITAYLGKDIYAKFHHEAKKYRSLLAEVRPQVSLLSVPAYDFYQNTKLDKDTVGMLMQLQKQTLIPQFERGNTTKKILYGMYDLSPETLVSFLKSSFEMTPGDAAEICLWIASDKKTLM